MPMVWWHFDRVFVAVHSTSTPTAEEWAEWTQVLRQPAARNGSCLIETRDGELTLTQRAALVEILRRQRIRLALVSDARVPRGIMHALTWLGLEMSAFPAGAIRDASHYLGLTELELARVLEELPRLRQAAGMASPSATRLEPVRHGERS